MTLRKLEINPLKKEKARMMKLLRIYIVTKTF